MYFLPPWSEKTLTPSEYSPAMAGWLGSRRSHAARRIRRRETHSAPAGQLLFIFDDAERGEGAVPEGGRAMSGLVRESWAGALGREEPSSCACAMRFPACPRPPHKSDVLPGCRHSALWTGPIRSRVGPSPPSTPNPRSSQQRPRTVLLRGPWARRGLGFLFCLGCFRSPGFRRTLSTYRAAWASPFGLSRRDRNAAYSPWRFTARPAGIAA